MFPLMLFAAVVGQPPDLVVENARIWTDGLPGFAENLVVRGGRIVHVGTADADLSRDASLRIDARGGLVTPGLIDAHIHMLSGGKLLSHVQLRDVRDKQEFIERIRAWAGALPPGEWVLGGRWSVETWRQPHQPTKEWIDAVTGERPAYLPRMDGHSALVNSAALRIANITRHGPKDPVGGVIDRDPATGEPTGILRESAMELVARHIPEPTLDSKVSALRRAMSEANAHGITAVGDIPGLDDLRTYERMAVQSLTLRWFVYPTTADWVAAVEEIRGFSAKPGWLEIRGLKAYVDGSLGSRTAWMRQPYLGNPPDRAEWRGLLREGVADGRLARNIAAARAARLQPMAHAIGDEANHLLLDLYEQAYGDPRAARCRIEHVQHLLEGDIARIGRLGVVAAMQPYHKADDGRYAEEYIGTQRCRLSYAFKSLLNCGAVVAFGSDWPVVTLNPMLGIEAAVTGRTLDGRQWQAQENITVGEALRCYTSAAAYALFAEREIGRLAEGYCADFVIWDGTPFASEPEWSKIRPAAVFVDGRCVYSNDERVGVAASRPADAAAP